MKSKNKALIKKYRWFFLWLGLWLIYRLIVIAGTTEPIMENVETVNLVFMLIVIYYIFRYNSVEDYYKQLEDGAIKDYCKKYDCVIIKNKKVKHGRV